MPDLGQLLIILPVLLFSLTIHEMAHAVTAGGEEAEEKIQEATAAIRRPPSA